jgi:hypothetical protein
VPKKKPAPATKKYTVTIPLAGAIHIQVQAADDEAAKAAAWNVINTEGFKAEDHDLEYEYMDELTRGNMLNAQYNETEVNEGEG